MVRFLFAPKYSIYAITMEINEVHCSKVTTSLIRLLDLEKACDGADTGVNSTGALLLGMVLF